MLLWQTRSPWIVLVTNSFASSSSVNWLLLSSRCRRRLADEAEPEPGVAVDRRAAVDGVVLDGREESIAADHPQTAVNVRGVQLQGGGGVGANPTPDRAATRALMAAEDEGRALTDADAATDVDGCPRSRRR